MEIANAIVPGIFVVVVVVSLFLESLFMSIFLECMIENNIVLTSLCVLRNVIQPLSYQRTKLRNHV